MNTKTSKGNWLIADLYGALITDAMPEGYPKRESQNDIQHYGGYLIAESIGNEHDMDLFVLAGNLAQKFDPRQWEQNCELVEKMTIALSSMVHHASIIINDNHPAMKNAKSLLEMINKQNLTEEAQGLL